MCHFVIKLTVISVAERTIYFLSWATSLWGQVSLRLCPSAAYWRSSFTRGKNNARSPPRCLCEHITFGANDTDIWWKLVFKQLSVNLNKFDVNFLLNVNFSFLVYSHQNGGITCLGFFFQKIITNFHSVIGHNVFDVLNFPFSFLSRYIMGEEGYCLTSVQTALKYLETLSNNLLASDEE